jgi:hypothetical protein
MRDGRKKSAGRKRGRVASKVPHIEFDMKAIEEVKKRKRGIYRRWPKRKVVS